MHSIQVSDELYEALDSSPSKIRDVLWQHVNRELLESLPRQADGDAEDFGTFIDLRYATNCNGEHRAPLFEGERALIRRRNGKAQILCLECAELERDGVRS